ncbi:hypothetical protein Q5P01_022415 [Channa striata]|uniref:Uncharacterized protein n=1 Tax=Channa striata TaxID=64152 RepID=A0AA88IW45_CHASR|nr:hypothetical protein Q5P01_022415 [Channa striata]
MPELWPPADRKVFISISVNCDSDSAVVSACVASYMEGSCPSAENRSDQRRSEGGCQTPSLLSELCCQR